MIVNNIEIIKSLLKFREGIFYYVQVIQRKKENPDLPKSDLKRYQCFITSMEDLDIHLPRIIKVCCDYNARAYISLIPRSLEKLTKQCALEYVKRISSEEYKRAWDIPNRLALSDEVRAKIQGEKPKWLFDIDKIEDKDAIINMIHEKNITISGIIPTPNGCHVLVEAFNPGLLMKYKSYEDYILPGGEKFTFRPDCNTILFAVLP
jgi:hypothetical protein